ncbi:winged helix-turn-helix domain-containing protein [Nonomuraea sp. SMC257]|uniref:Winged helix-turn-helix domain-containing protein n=1 Tax=Nonomuraea montanisoli TaxID=2741721 RepID=A0A7Y6I7Y5_9ACTN|nr:BTAD domain-containing putative transcriptional regulator [Nonomuraea montanisoli]NUW33387.1 winged helix-turn-helix domain-containing protein [Nonomuraea montanisoli]
MQFGILGPLEVRTAGGETVAVGGPRPRALLALLMLDAGHLVSVERLIDGQYGDDPPAGAANAIQTHVSRLRRNLPAGLVEFHGAGYLLAVDREDVDAHRFERLAREGRESLAAGQHERAARLLTEALALWRGPALADVADAPFAQPQAARLEEARLAAREDLAEAELALPGGAPVAELRDLVAAHPLRERPRGLLMRALHASGQQAAALAVYDETRRLLADELGADPAPELAELHLAILRGEEHREQAPRRRLPAPLNQLIGREEELARIAALGDARLVTIIGPGGTGKTRLAVEAAHRAGPGREAGFADLSPVDDGSQAPLAVLGALGLREAGLQAPAAGRPDPVDRLVAALADQPLLLVLDNCEHVIAAAAELARRLLDACPGLTILATSREPLGLTGEALVPLAPLAVPPPGTDPADALSYPAVRLFAERAAAVRPGFTIGPEVAEICATLDGLPLAIELAAARLRTFTGPEIAARLNEHGRFKLLSRGDRTAAARHRTLHAVVEWSWSLLSPEEREAARRFSVFAGGASLEAAESVCGDGDVLADLVDKSLVEADGGRYRMLDTIRLFCAERLAEAGDQRQARDAHAAWYLDLARRADPWLRRAEQLDWLATLSAEHDNLQAALRHSVQDDPETASRLVGALAAYWWLSGRRGEITSSVVRLLDRTGGEPLEGLEEEYVLCVLLAVRDLPPERWARAAEIMRSIDRELRHPFLAVLWGMTAGPVDSATIQGRGRLLDSDPWSQAVFMLGEALIALLQGRPGEGERRLEETLARFRGLGERWGMAQALEWLAMIASWRGDWAGARRFWAQALDLHGQFGSADEQMDVLCRRAAGLVREGDLAGARADLEQATELARRTGMSGSVPALELGWGDLARFSGDLDEARARYTATLESAVSGAYVTEGMRPFAHTALGRLAEAEGDLAEAGRRHAEALRLARGAVYTDVADVAEGLAGPALLEGAAERAAYLLGVGAALRGTTITGDRDVARVAAGVTGFLGAEAFAAHFAKGAALSQEEALSALFD